MEPRCVIGDGGNAGVVNDFTVSGAALVTASNGFKIGGGSGAQTSTLLVENSASLTIPGGSFTMGTGTIATVNNLTVSGGSVTSAPSLTVGSTTSPSVNTLNFTGGTATFANSGNSTLDLEQGTMNLNGGVVTVDRLLEQTPSSIAFTSGTLNTAQSSVANQLTIGNGSSPATLNLYSEPGTSGTHSFAGGIIISAAAQLTGTANNLQAGTNGIADYGTMQLSGTAQGPVTIYSGGTLLNTNRTSSFGALTLNSGGLLQMTQGGSLAFTGGLTWNGASSQTAQIDLTPGSGTVINVSGALANGGGSYFDFNFNGFSPSGAGTYDLINFGTTTFTSGTYFSYNNLTVPSGYGASFSLVSGSLDLVLASLNSSILNLPSSALVLNQHVGDGAVSGLTGVSESSGQSSGTFTAVGAGLSVSPSAATGVAASGSVGLIVGWNTATAGAQSGTISIINTANTNDNAGTKTQSVNGGVYNYAAAAAAQTVTVGPTLVGFANTASVVLSNTAPVNSLYTETLSGTGFGTTNANFTAAGSVSLIPGGGSGSGSLLVGLSGLSSGHQNGTVTLGLTSNAVNNSGLGVTPIGGQTITIQGDVYDPANLAAAGSSTSGNVTTFPTPTRSTAVLFGRRPV